MKSYHIGEHPIEQSLQKIKEEGIVVMNNVKGLPSCEGSFVSPEYVICICHRGHLDLMYDEYPDFSEQYTVGVIFPNHKLVLVNQTDDYEATMIAVDSSVLADPMLRIINQMRYRYEPHPCVKLDRHQYRMIMNVVELMQENADLNFAERKLIQLRQLWFLLRLLGTYRQLNLNEIDNDKRVSTQFHNDLAKHIREHRDVGFYAEKACLSVKYFSNLVKQETGQAASYWIHAQVVSEAKKLLHTRRDLAVQAIAYMLGFDEQATFSRYFHRETGLSPTEFRNGADKDRD